MTTVEMSRLGGASSPTLPGRGVPSLEDMADDGVVAVRSDARPVTSEGGAVAHPGDAAEDDECELCTEVLPPVAPPLPPPPPIPDGPLG